MNWEEGDTHLDQSIQFTYFSFVVCAFGVLYKN